MIKIQQYMNDGACWQAQAVLAYLRGNVWKITEEKPYSDLDIDVNVGRYENCREQGYVFTFRFYKNGRLFQRNYAVYEYRNCDTVCVLISNAFTLNTPGISEMWKDKGENPKKYQYDKGFSYDDINGCGEFIIQDMENYLQDL